MTQLKVTLKTDYGKVTVKNGNGRARLKRKKTGKVKEKVKKSKRTALQRDDPQGGL